MVDVPMFGVDPLIYWSTLGTIAFVTIIYFAVSLYRSRTNIDDTPGTEIATDGGHLRELSPPNIRNARLGIPQELFRVWRFRRKQRKLAGKGYIKWLRVDDTLQSTKYVKPEREGGGIPELKHNGERWLFPRDALVPDNESGMWVAIHNTDDAEPINPKQPDEHAIAPDGLQEYLTRRVSVGPPGWLDKLDLDAQTMIRWAIFAVIGYAILQGLMGGGIL